MSEEVRIDIRGRAAVVTICRPQARNALSRAVLEQLGAAVRQVRENPEVGAIVLTGDGDKAFVAGADIKEMSVLDEAGAREYSQLGQRVFAEIESSPKPVIAAVNGFALGGGCELAMACHIRYASSTARFGQPEVKLGLIPGFGGTQRLSRLIGKGRALEMLLDGNKMLSADEALRVGLVNAVLPAEQLLPECLKLADRIQAMGPQALAWVIAAQNRGEDAGDRAGYACEAELFGRCFATDDGQEGMTAFLERRPANFKGS